MLPFNKLKLQYGRNCMLEKLFVSYALTQHTTLSMFHFVLLIYPI